jgi:hypothetical protein
VASHIKHARQGIPNHKRGEPHQTCPPGHIKPQTWRSHTKHARRAYQTTNACEAGIKHARQGIPNLKHREVTPSNSPASISLHRLIASSLYRPFNSSTLQPFGLSHHSPLITHFSFLTTHHSFLISGSGALLLFGKIFIDVFSVKTTYKLDDLIRNDHSYSVTANTDTIFVVGDGKFLQVFYFRQIVRFLNLTDYGSNSFKGIFIGYFSDILFKGSVNLNQHYPIP